MINQNQYIPKVIVAGDVEQFRAKISNLNKPARIVGVASFVGEYNGQHYDIVNNKTLLIDDKIINASELKKMADESKFDYIVFVDYFNFNSYIIIILKNTALRIDRIITFDTFVYKSYNGFYSAFNESLLFNILGAEKMNAVLDIDSSFSAGQIYTKPDPLRNIEIDTIRSENNCKFPIFNNVYNHIYDSLNECQYRHYDMIILSAERSIEDLITTMRNFLNQTNQFVIFFREEVKLNDVIPIILNKFINIFNTSISVTPCVNGKWLRFIKRPAENTAIYVVTHKKVEIDKLPDDYIIIHAGRKLGKDLGYIGDDTGQSISELNISINEMTAVYWIWKNTSHDYVGISHYRRFFSNKDNKDFVTENILTSEQTREILKTYDIIVAKGEYHAFNTYSYIFGDSGPLITRLAINVTRNVLERHYPDYVEAFDYVMSDNHIFKCNMFITRKYILDSYCSWLFSFILEAESEYRKFVNIEELTVKQRRVYGFICERMFNVWLMKNNLRIKELNIMENLSL